MFDIPHAFSIDAIIASDSKTVMKEATKEVKMFANHLKRVLPDRTVVPACYACFFKQTTLLLARSRLLTLVSVADHVHHLLSVTDLAIDHNPRDPLVVLGSLVSSLEVEQRTLSTLRALQNDLGVHTSLLGALLHTIVREIGRRLLAKNELPRLLIGEVLLSAQLHVVAIAFLVTMLALESGRITSDHSGIAVGNEFKISDRHHVIELTELNEVLSDELLAARAVRLIVESGLHLLSLQSLLAGSGLLTSVGIANSLQEVLTVVQHSVVHNHPRNPSVIGSLVSSLEVEQRTLSALRALQNDIRIDESHLTTVLHTLLREVNRALLANEEVPPLLREVLLSAQLHVVAVTLLLAVLALEGGRIASQNLGVAVGNDVDVGNGHHIVELTELNKILGDKHLAIRAVGFDVKGDLHIIGLDITLPKENPTAIARAAIVKVTAKILESIRRLFCLESQVGYFKNPIGC